MKLTVLGAGAIGAYVGACVERAGAADVTLVARGAHLDAMRERGVTVRSAEGEFTVHPRVEGELTAIASADVVFCGLKAHQIPPVASSVGERLSPETAIVWAQNGIPFWYFQALEGPLGGTVLESVDPGGLISASIAPAHNVGCVVYCATELVAPGVVHHLEGNRFSLGEPSGEPSERCRAIAGILTASGLKAPVEARLRDNLWLKLIGNVAFNPVSALTRATLGELGERRDMVQLLHEMLEECASVAGALGVCLPLSIDRRLQAAFAVGDHRTSMLQDLEHGKPLELECMTGAVIELAGLLGIEVPRVRTVHACVALLDRLSRRVPEP